MIELFPGLGMWIYVSVVFYFEVRRISFDFAVNRHRGVKKYLAPGSEAVGWTL